MRSRSDFSKALLVAMLFLPLGACVTSRAGNLDVAEADRWEASNRRIYAFNKKVDRYALRPAAKVYRTVIPEAGRHGITNFFSNYGEPASFLNALLQGKIKQAFRTVDRFFINTVLGVGGLADNATDLGRPQEPEDFGQTFAAWGIKSGPYVMLPIFGPSTLRESFGLAFDLFADPSDIARNAALSPSLFVRGGQIAVRIVNLRARVSEQGADQLLADSLDEYALVKSAYLQRRIDLMYDGNPPYVAVDDGTVDDAVPAPVPAPGNTAPPPPPK